MGGALPSGRAVSDADAQTSAGGAGEPAAVSSQAAARAEARGLLPLAIAGGIAVGLVLATAMLVSGPHPDATLQPTGVEPDEQLILLLESEGLELGLANPPGFGSEMVIDISTLRAFGTYEGIEVWSAVNAFESPCLIAIHRASIDVISRRCVPVSAEVFIDTRDHGLPLGERLRFVLRDDTVAVHHLVLEEAG